MFVCDYCEYKFRLLNELEMHIWEIHCNRGEKAISDLVADHLGIFIPHLEEQSAEVQPNNYADMPIPHLEAQQLAQYNTFIKRIPRRIIHFEEPLEIERSSDDEETDQVDSSNKVAYHPPNVIDLISDDESSDQVNSFKQETYCETEAKNTSSVCENAGKAVPDSDCADFFINEDQEGIQKHTNESTVNNLMAGKTEIDTEIFPSSCQNEIAAEPDSAYDYFSNDKDQDYLQKSTSSSTVNNLIDRESEISTKCPNVPDAFVDISAKEEASQEPDKGPTVDNPMDDEVNATCDYLFPDFSEMSTKCPNMPDAFVDISAKEEASQEPDEGPTVDNPMDDETEIDSEVFPSSCTNEIAADKDSAYAYISSDKDQDSVQNSANASTANNLMDGKNEMENTYYKLDNELNASNLSVSKKMSDLVFLAQFENMGLRTAPENGIVQPPTEPPDGKPYRNTNALQYLLQTVKAISRHRFAWPFRKPVDTVQLNIPDYHEIIKYPIDLMTIKKRIENFFYYDVKECIKDLQLLFYDCYKYNRVDEPVVVMCEAIEELFLTKMEGCPKEEYEIPIVEKKGTGKGQKRKKAGRPKGCSSSLFDTTFSTDVKHASCNDIHQSPSHLGFMAEKSGPLPLEKVHKKAAIDLGVETVKDIPQLSIDSDGNKEASHFSKHSYFSPNDTKLAKEYSDCDGSKIPIPFETSYSKFACGMQVTKKAAMDLGIETVKDIQQHSIDQPDGNREAFHFPKSSYFSSNSIKLAKEHSNCSGFAEQSKLFKTPFSKLIPLNKKSTMARGTETVNAIQQQDQPDGKTDSSATKSKPFKKKSKFARGTSEMKTKFPNVPYAFVDNSLKGESSRVREPENRPTVDSSMDDEIKVEITCVHPKSTGIIRYQEPENTPKVEDNTVDTAVVPSEESETPSLSVDEFITELLKGPTCSEEARMAVPILPEIDTSEYWQFPPAVPQKKKKVPARRVFYIGEDPLSLNDSDPEDTAVIKDTVDSKDTAVIKDIVDPEDLFGIKDCVDPEDLLGIKDFVDPEDTTGIKDIVDQEDSTGIQNISDSEDTTDFDLTLPPRMSPIIYKLIMKFINESFSYDKIIASFKKENSILVLQKKVLLAEKINCSKAASLFNSAAKYVKLKYYSKAYDQYKLARDLILKISFSYEMRSGNYYDDYCFLLREDSEKNVDDFLLEYDFFEPSEC